MLWLMLLLPLALLVLGFPIFLLLLVTVTHRGGRLSPTCRRRCCRRSCSAASAISRLLAVPFFIFAGELMGRGGMARRLVAIVMALFGGFRGSMPITTVGAATLYGAISGSTAATVAALGPLVYPPLRKAGYDEKFSTGVITSAGALANIIPPSIAMILYGAAAEQSVVKLFAAGVLPGLVIAALMSLYIYFYARRQRHPRGRAVPLARYSSPRLKDGAWALGAPVIVFGGIYAGVFSPTEAAGAACVYAIFVTMGVQREIGWREFWDVSVTSMYLTAQIFLIVAVAGVFSWLLTTSGVAHVAVDFIARSARRALAGAAGHQCLSADRRLLHRHGVRHPGADPAAGAHRHRHRRRSHPFRHHRHRESEHRHVHAAVRAQYFHGAGDLRRAAAQHLCRPRCHSSR